MAKQAFLDFVCRVCDENLGDSEKRAAFVQSLRENPDKIAQLLNESLSGGDMPIRAETLGALERRTDVSPSDTPKVMERLKLHFLG